MRHWQTIMRGYPAPKKGDPEESQKLYMHRVYHDRDPTYRDSFADRLAQKLIRGDALLECEREWLLFVLGTAIRDDKIPHLAKGRRPVDRVRYWDRWHALNDALRSAPPGESITDTIGRAAGAAHVEFTTMSNLYYSPAFQRWLSNIHPPE